MKRTWIAVVALAGLGSLAACGSTVNLGASSLATSTGIGSDLGAAGAVTTSTAPPQSGGSSSSGGAAAAPSTVAATSSAAATSADSSAAASEIAQGITPTTTASEIPKTGKGWDASTIYIGVTNQSDVESAAHDLNLKVDPGDVAADIQAVVNDINAHGGLFGRKIDALVKDNSSASISTDPDSVANATCTFFTQDHTVMSVINLSTGIDIDSLRSCLAKNQTPLDSVSVQPIDNEVFKQYGPYFFAGVSASINDVAPVLAQHLESEGYFSGWNTAKGAPGTAKAKVGLL